MVQHRGSEIHGRLPINLQIQSFTTHQRRSAQKIGASTRRPKNHRRSFKAKHIDGQRCQRRRNKDLIAHDPPVDGCEGTLPRWIIVDNATVRACAT